MSKIILSAFADEYSSSFDKQIAVLKENGFDMIEPRFIDGVNVSDLSFDVANSVHARLEDNNLKVSSLGSPLGKIKLDDDFTAHLEKVKRTVEIAHILGTDKIRMFSFYSPEGKDIKDCKEQVVDYVGKMLDIACDAGVKLCHENEAKIYGESPEKCLELLKIFNGKLRCVFDMGNFVLDGYKPFPTGYDMLKDYIEYFHIKDSLSAGAVVPAGKGEACVKEILTQYKNDFNRDFVITLEPHLQTFDGLNMLAGRSFDNPYKFNTPEEAFFEGINSLNGILWKVLKKIN